MMCNFKKINLILFFLMFCIIFINSTKVKAQSILEKDTLILYDLENYYGDNRNSIRVIENLFGKFNHSSDKAELSLFQESLDSYSIVVIFAVEDNFENQKLLDELKNFKGKILWIGSGLNQLDIELKDKGAINNLIRVIYDNKHYDLGVQRYFRIVEYPENAKIYSELYDGKNYYPFIIQNDNFWYISRLDLNEPLFFIFTDVLYDFFEEEPEGLSGLYFRIQDINPYTNEKSLKKTIDFFIEKKIPFALSVIPIYREEGSNFKTKLRENQKLLKIIKYGIDNGGSLIVQGGHQYFSEREIIGEDFFVWKKGKNKSEKEWIDDIVKEALSEMAYNELYPTIFDTKHFLLNERAYNQVSKYFDTLIGWVQDRNWIANYTIYPYELHNIYGFKNYIPENLTMDRTNEAYELQNLDERIRRITITKNYLAGIAISSEIDKLELQKVVNFIEKKEFPYLNLRKIDLTVKSEIYDLEQINGKIKITVKDVEKPNFGKNILGGFSYIVIIFLIFIVILFAKMYIKSKMQTLHKLFKGN